MTKSPSFILNYYLVAANFFSNFYGLLRIYELYNPFRNDLVDGHSSEHGIRALQLPKHYAMECTLPGHPFWGHELLASFLYEVIACYAYSRKINNKILEILQHTNVFESHNKQPFGILEDPIGSLDSFGALGMYFAPIVKF